MPNEEDTKKDADASELQDEELDGVSGGTATAFGQMQQQNARATTINSMQSSVETQMVKTQMAKTTTTTK